MIRLCLSIQRPRITYPFQLRVMLGTAECVMGISRIVMANIIEHWESRIGRRLKLRDLHVLFAVVQWGSMAKAAKHLGGPKRGRSTDRVSRAVRLRLVACSHR